jgi:hypothetical protein
MMCIHLIILILSLQKNLRIDLKLLIPTLGLQGKTINYGRIIVLPYKIDGHFRGILCKLIKIFFCDFSNLIFDS